MVFVGGFMGNNKTTPTPGPQPPPVFRLFVTAIDTGGGEVAIFNGFGSTDVNIPVGETIEVAENLESGSTDICSGSAFEICGDPSEFTVTNAQLTELSVEGSTWSCRLSDFTEDATLTIPVSAGRPPPSGFNLSFVVIPAGEGGFASTFSGFRVETEPIEATGEPVLLASNLELGGGSIVSGRAFDMVGDPGMFMVEGARFANFMIIGRGDEWSVEVYGVEGDVTIYLPVGFGRPP